MTKIATSSPRMTEYGKLRETKNGLKATSRAGAGAKPKPDDDDTANASAIHVVIVSGTVTLKTAFPSELRKDVDKAFL